MQGALVPLQCPWTLYCYAMHAARCPHAGRKSNYSCTGSIVTVYKMLWHGRTFSGPTLSWDTRVSHVLPQALAIFNQQAESSRSGLHPVPTTQMQHLQRCWVAKASLAKEAITQQQNLSPHRHCSPLHASPTCLFVTRAHPHCSLQIHCHGQKTKSTAVLSCLPNSPCSHSGSCLKQRRQPRQRSRKAMRATSH